jgi:hypothetical protein
LVTGNLELKLADFGAATFQSPAKVVATPPKGPPSTSAPNRSPANRATNAPTSMAGASSCTNFSLGTSPTLDSIPWLP